MERRLADAAGQQHPWHGRHLIELRTRVAPSTAVHDRRVVGELGLQDVAADRGQASCGLDDDPPARLAAERLALDKRERQRFHEERQVDLPAVGRDAGHERLLVRGVGGIGVVVHEELGGGRSHPLGLRDSPAVEDPADAGRRRTLVARRLDRHDQAGAARQRPVGDALGRADLWIEQRPGRDGGQRAHDGTLEVDHLVVGHGPGVVGAQLASQVLAVIEGEHAEGSPRGGARIEPATGPGPEATRGNRHEDPRRRTRRALSR